MKIFNAFQVVVFYAIAPWLATLPAVDQRVGGFAWVLWTMYLLFTIFMVAAVATAFYDWEGRR